MHDAEDAQQPSNSADKRSQQRQNNSSADETRRNTEEHSRENKRRGPRLRKWKSSSLQPGEYVIREYYPSFLPEALVWIIACVLTLGLTIPFFAVHLYIRKQFCWAITNRRLLSRLGVIDKRFMEVDFDRITDIAVDKPLLAQFFGTGRVLINTAGAPTPEFIIHGQRNPDAIRNDILLKKDPELQLYRENGSYPNEETTPEGEREDVRVLARLLLEEMRKINKAES